MEPDVGLVCIVAMEVAVNSVLPDPSEKPEWPSQIQYVPPSKGFPHRCPVCSGNGIVPDGFYTQTTGQWNTASTETEPCRSCDGKGIVWG